LAVAVAADPILLVADEPTAEVDRETELRLIDHFKQRRRAGKSTLFATHSEAMSGIADRVLKMRDGKLIND
jgi:putative ABC transport system ATP-binding protein